MVEIALKSDPQKAGWFVSGDADPGVTHFHWRLATRSHLWRPPTDVYVTDEAIIVRVEIAGMRDAEFSISLEGQRLRIQGNRPDQPERRAYHRMEIQFGEFSTEVDLHWPVDAGAVEAEYRDGFLRVVLPRAKSQQVRITD